MKKIFTVSILLVLWCYGCSKKQNTGLVTNKAMVVSARIEASQIGSDIMKKGGNAFDAMVATELSLAVAYPFAGNLGGGGFMVYRLENGVAGSLDFREKAPMAATKNMYVDSLGNVIPNLSTLGAKAIGVPGTIAGLLEAHEKYGKLPLREVIQPVINLAVKGVVVTKKQANTLKNYKDIIVQTSGDSTYFAKEIKEGDTLKYPKLAATLKIIQQQGKDGFYKGKVAKSLVNLIQKHGGLITKEDLAAYQAKWRKPITFNYKNLHIISMAPPSSGGITLEEIMKMIAPYPIEKYGHNSTKTIQVITEAERRAYADRNYFLGDPDFVHIPTDTLTNDEYLKKRMHNFSFEKATPSTAVSHGNIQIVESNETTHFSIVDQYGNAISVTTTLNGAYGCKLYSDDLGFFLNNEMDDFSSKPGVPNMFGLTGAEANSIAPQKRMLSSMTPTIVEKDGKLAMVVGTPGGSTIITSVLQTILNVYDFNMGMQQAVDAARFHHQWLPDEVMFEPNGFSKNTLDTLKSKGYYINENNSPIIGKVDAILRLDNQKLEAGADKRGDDAAAGF
ncbi:gamma-glutamyltransferase [Zhouia sp. PK063]|uniref:gamma-glutamyltransferase n=1 Tax=Zhouia sp. PK063 TaxID=3373602 RepID=UPI00379FD28E